MNILTTPIIYERSKKSKPLALSNGLYKIETIPVGAFVKDNAKSGVAHERIAFEVDDSLLRHWKDTFEKMKWNGIEVVMPLNHTEDPEARRATVVDFEIAPNDKGDNALFTIFKPKNEKVIESLKDTSVSIFVPPKFVDGKGNEYHYPIKHVCFTDYPVIPGMSKMAPYSGLPEGAIAASYVENPEKKKGKNMAGEKEGKEYDDPQLDKVEEDEKEIEEGKDEDVTEVSMEMLRELAGKLGLEGIPDNKLWVAINHVVDAIVESVHGEDGEEEEEEEEGEGVGKKPTGHVAHRIEHKEEHYHPPGGAMHEQPIAAGFISMGRKARLQEIDILAQQGYLTPKVKQALILEFCSDDALQLAFSPEGDLLDNFDKTISLIKSNGKVIKTDEKSQNDAYALSHAQLNESSDILVKDADRRRAAAGQA